MVFTAFVSKNKTLCHLWYMTQFNARTSGNFPDWLQSTLDQALYVIETPILNPLYTKGPQNRVIKCLGRDLGAANERPQQAWFCNLDPGMNFCWNQLVLCCTIERCSWGRRLPSPVPLSQGECWHFDTGCTNSLHKYCGFCSLMQDWGSLSSISI